MVGRDDAVGGLGLLGAEVFEAGVQACDALRAALGGELALFGGVEAALGRAFDADDLGADCLATFIEGGPLAQRFLVNGGERVMVERTVAVDAQ